MKNNFLIVLLLFSSLISFSQIETGAMDVTIECEGGSSNSALDVWLQSNGGAVASADCGTVTWENDFTGLNGECDETVTIIFTATSSCATDFTTATVTIQDTVPPSSIGNLINVTLECDSDISLLDEVLFEDNCSNITIDYNESIIDGACVGEQVMIRSWRVTDSCDNDAFFSQTVVFIDTSGPRFNSLAVDMTVTCDGSDNIAELNAWLLSNGGATATDNCSDVTWSNDFTDLNTDCSETVSIEVAFTASDDCGNQSTTFASFFIERSNSSCPEGPITLSSQAAVDAFIVDYPDCTTLTNILSISGADITNLSALSNLEIVGGIEIVNNPLLVNLDALENLTTLLDGFTVFSIRDNASLQSISGLGGITGSLSHVINIRNNPVLQSLIGLEGLTSTEDTCQIVNNDSLTDLTGLTNFEGCDDLLIEDNDSLVSIDGLAASFSTGRFYFINNDAIVSFQNQSLINPQCGIVITDNELLEDIDGFVGVYNFECELEITIINNPNLSICSTAYTCNYISNLDLSFGSIEVRDNALDCNTVFEISSACNQEPFNDECEGGQLEELVIGQTYNVSLNLASKSNYTPLCNDFSERADVWFTFNSSNITSLLLSVGVDNSFQIWEGDCDNLVAISGLCGSNVISFETAENKQYYLQLWASDNQGRSTQLTDDFQILVTDSVLTDANFDVIEFDLFPNPFKEKVSLTSNKNIETIYIYNIQGKMVEQIKINGFNSTLNLSGYASGMYFLKLVNKDATATRKIVKL